MVRHQGAGQARDGDVPDHLTSGGCRHSLCRPSRFCEITQSARIHEITAISCVRNTKIFKSNIGQAELSAREGNVQAGIPTLCFLCNENVRHGFGRSGRRHHINLRRFRGTRDHAISVRSIYRLYACNNIHSLISPTFAEIIDSTLVTPQESPHAISGAPSDVPHYRQPSGQPTRMNPVSSICPI
jgi:hypothetical protein